MAVSKRECVTSLLLRTEFMVVDVRKSFINSWII
jgi:hypothetical protein